VETIITGFGTGWTQKETCPLEPDDSKKVSKGEGQGGRSFAGWDRICNRRSVLSLPDRVRVGWKDDIANKGALTDWMTWPL